MSHKSLKFNIEKIIEKDTDEVYKFALEYFMKDEPLSKAVGLLHCDEGKEFILSGIPDHCSFKAVNADGVIIGLVISRLTQRPIADEVDNHNIEDESCNEKYKKLMYIMDYCDKQWNIFDLYPKADIILDGRIIAVDPKYRGLGIAGQLIQKCRDYMHENNIPLMRRVCSSHYSARVMEKMGMKEVHRLIYDDFKVNGELYLKIEPPHVGIRSFVMEI